MTKNTTYQEVSAGIYPRLFKYFRAYSGCFLLAFLGYFLFALSQPAFAILMEAFVRALDGEYVDGLYLIPAACIAIAFMRGIGSYLGSYYMSKGGANVIHKMRCELFENIIALPLSFTRVCHYLIIFGFRIS